MSLLFLSQEFCLLCTKKMIIIVGGLSFCEHIFLYQTVMKLSCEIARIINLSFAFLFFFFFGGGEINM